MGKLRLRKELGHIGARIQTEICWIPALPTYCESVTYGNGSVNYKPLTLEALISVLTTQRGQVVTQLYREESEAQRRWGNFPRTQ